MYLFVLRFFRARVHAVFGVVAQEPRPVLRVCVCARGLGDGRVSRFRVLDAFLMRRSFCRSEGVSSVSLTTPSTSQSTCLPCRSAPLRVTKPTRFSTSSGLRAPRRARHDDEDGKSGSMDAKATLLDYIGLLLPPPLARPLAALLACTERVIARPSPPKDERGPAARGLRDALAVLSYPRNCSR